MAIDPRVSTDGELWRLEMLRLTDTCATLLNGGVAPGGGGAPLDAAAITAGIDASGDIAEILRILKNAQIFTPVLYTDTVGTIFSPEITLNPDTGAFVRSYRTFPGGAPYAPQGAPTPVGSVTAEPLSVELLQQFRRISDGAEMFGSYKSVDQTILPYLGTQPIDATGWVPVPPNVPPSALKVARLELPSNAAVVAAGAQISISGPNLGMFFEGSPAITLGVDSSAFALRYPAQLRITIAGILADENELNWMSPTTFSYAQEIWPGTDIVIEYQEIV
ncbi:MAG: hypothetical protein HC771_12195 [Synechococcales cyanobacterium CRU_2_2]|nr:hypothetical protein [Synechococcales cyanobacterium CRU_2_2]